MNKDSKENDNNNNLFNEISCGELLAQTRREKGLNAEEIAKELRINISVIEMMEDNDFQSIGAPVFAKGYLRQYANILGLSAESLLEEYNQLNPDKNSAPIVNKTAEQISKYVLTPKLILMIASFFLVLLIISMIVSSLSQTEAVSNQEASIEDLIIDDLSVLNEISPIEMQESVIEELKPIDDQDINPVLNEISPIEMQESVMEELKPIDDQDINPVLNEISPIAMQESVIEESGALFLEPEALSLIIEYSGLCWTEIYDVNGQLLFYDMGNFDKTVVVIGIGPLDVLFGAASEVLSLRVDNQNYPLPESSRQDEVLRFSVSNL